MKTLITGAASGIGRATADRLAADGHRLVLLDRAPIADAPAGADCVVGDVSDETMWEAIAPRLAGLTHAIVNAGVPSASPIADTDLAEWRRVMGVNLDGAFLTLRAALRAMDEDAAADRAIVVTASASGLKPEPGIAAYASSKAAVIMLAKVAAKEAAPRGIRVNAIAPGGVDTPIWDAMPFFAGLIEREGSREAALEAMARAGVPLGRYATEDEIAAQIAFLLSPASAPATGAVWTVDGGYSL